MSTDSPATRGLLGPGPVQSDNTLTQSTSSRLWPAQQASVRVTASANFSQMSASRERKYFMVCIPGKLSDLATEMKDSLHSDSARCLLAQGARMLCGVHIRDSGPIPRASQVGGKGGVGKTSLSASLAVKARAARRTGVEGQLHSSVHMRALATRKRGFRGDPSSAILLFSATEISPAPNTRSSPSRATTRSSSPRTLRTPSATRLPRQARCKNPTPSRAAGNCSGCVSLT